ncbi:MAG TPA: NAD(P)-binding domain-containing protein, partial [Chitinophaga sp.]
MNNRYDVVMVGLGYIGLPTAGLMAGKGVKVLGVDINPSVVETINSGKIHIIEPDLDGLIHHVISKGMLKAQTTPTYGKVYLIAVPTPFHEDFEPDISYVLAATTSIIDYLEEGSLVILESTSPVGTTQKLKELIDEKRPDLAGKYYLAYCPERVLPGN